MHVVAPFGGGREAVDAVVEGQYQFRLLPEASVSDFAIWDGERLFAADTDEQTTGKPVELSWEVYNATSLSITGGTDDYVTEVHHQAEAFIRTLAERLVRGAAFFIDYGFPEAEYYHAQRHMGTLMCHRAHMADPDPLKNPSETATQATLAQAASRGGAWR